MSPDDFDKRSARAQDGDEVAINALMEDVYKIIDPILKKHLWSIEEVEAVMSETVLRIWQKRTDCDTNWEAWCRRIAVNMCKDYRKKKAKEKEKVVFVSIEGEELDEELYVEPEAGLPAVPNQDRASKGYSKRNQDTVRTIVKDVIDKLPEKIQEFRELRYEKGLSLQEIAKEWDKRYDAARQIASRRQKNISSRLEEQLSNIRKLSWKFAPWIGKPVLSSLGFTTMGVIGGIAILMGVYNFVTILSEPKQKSTSQPPVSSDKSLSAGLVFPDGQSEKPRLNIAQAPTDKDEKRQSELLQGNSAGGGRGGETTGEKLQANITTAGNTETEEPKVPVAPKNAEVYTNQIVAFRGELYSTTTSGIVKSARGHSWMPVNEGFMPNRSVNGILRGGAFLSILEAKFYAATNSGIQRLAANGTWMPIQTHMLSSNGDRITAVDQLEISENTYYLLSGRRLYRWKQGEKLWTELGQKFWHRGGLVWRKGGLVVSGKTVYLQRDKDGEIIRSFDEGNTWTSAPRLPQLDWVVQPKMDTPNCKYDSKTDSLVGRVNLHVVGDTIYANLTHDIFRPDGDKTWRLPDGGKKWIPVTEGLPNEDIRIQLVDGNTLYGTNSEGIFCSTQGSNSWELITPTTHPVLSLAFDGVTFYASTRAGEIEIYQLSLDK